MKKIKILLLGIFLLISFYLSCTNIFTLLMMRNAEKIDAVITFIGLPDGHIFGDFIDSDGCIHKEEFLGSHNIVHGTGKKNAEKAEKYVGKHITILYNKKSGDIIIYDITLTKIINFLIVFLVSLILILASVKNK